ncbi:hypothetical protein GCM10007972_09500 [Iodidimonas muriae]|uniref:Cytoskeleton protein RodZ-like C-terminal domain-containing protein n=1 Tax=Iodidimonas muriae TaxID=261467 RepID=A0ABQ2LAR2_9PROT|nr:helix-turn-helix domain-containing protein [Iodidimonas muriae]GGO08760.1 hypothetical protein GCM10007972_09500 [Iodidimonas muriae]
MTDATLSVSVLLKEARLQKGRALNDIATELKIKSRYLEALEAGTYEDLPPPAFSAGFVRSYATLLGLDGCALAREFRCEMGEDCEKAGLNFPEPVAESRIPGRVVLVSGACAMLAIYFGWIADFGTPSFAESAVEPVPAHLAALGAQQTGSISDALPADQAPKSQPAMVRETAPSSSQRSNPSARTALMAALPRSLDKTPDPKFITTATSGFDTASRPQSEPESTKTQAGNASMNATLEKAAHTDSVAQTESRLVLQAMGDAWLYIVDAMDREVWNGVLRRGERWTPPSGATGLRLMTSNAGALRILVDGKEIKPLGKSGDVVRDISLNPDRLKKREKLAMR